MSNRRVKNIDYDDYDYDDYFDNEYEEESSDVRPTDGDQEQLRLGLAQVRNLLSNNDQFPDEEIQESLWYYYFDVSKTVTYLKSTSIACPQLSV